MDRTYMEVEDLEEYQKLCKLHIEVCDLSHDRPQEERYELGSQVRRSSNSSPAQFTTKFTRQSGSMWFTRQFTEG